MAPRAAVFALLAAAVASGAAVLVAAPAAGQSNALRPVSSFGDITDERARSIALFEEAGKVITSPRCMNCHPADNSPTQTDTMRRHQPLVVRGATGHGTPGLACQICHHDENSEAGAPGHPDWHLAPESMAWQGRSLGEICTLIKDPARNGNRDMATLIRHMSEDGLVGWAWAPGGARTPAPGTQAEFGNLVKAWADSGAYCPP